MRHVIAGAVAAALGVMALTAIATPAKANANATYVQSSAGAWPVLEAVRYMDQFTGSDLIGGYCQPHNACITIDEVGSVYGRTDWVACTVYVSGLPVQGYKQFRTSIVVGAAFRNKPRAYKEAILRHELGHAMGVVEHTHTGLMRTHPDEHDTRLGTLERYILARN